MDTEKYTRSIPLQCPTCGSTQFEHFEESELVKCASCSREHTKDDLVRENSENIDEHANEIAKQATKDLERQLKKQFQDAFKDNKFIKIK
jgi:uncharacterized Zn finger protein (UPF0148 family)